ncbi:ankyrin repeat-containing domain protein [Immersiella caudata]|uniref:Ankyrin repeat-containing domain protein n=1 Tax=Immersiella caudata TaxID=314043 RepID=A0AA39T250_9PEZI|nr:ankyrin repeat-containing domain protein [Immersiella caudata]
MSEPRHGKAKVLDRIRTLLALNNQIISTHLEALQTGALGIIQQLREEGLLNSDAPSESEPEPQPRPTSRYLAPYYETESESDASSILGPRVSRPYTYSTHQTQPRRGKIARKKWSPGLSSSKEVDSDLTSDVDSEGTITPTSTPTSSRTRRSSTGAGNPKPKDGWQDEPPRPDLERKSSSYTRSGSNLVSSLLNPEAGASSPNATRNVSRRPKLERREPFTVHRDLSPSESSRSSAGSGLGSQGAARESTRRRRPRWMYRTKGIIIPRYRSGNLSSKMLPLAADNGLLAHVQMCLTMGSHIESCGPLRSSKKDPSLVEGDPEDPGKAKTALCITVEKGHFEIAKFLLECGANVDSASLYHPVLHNQIEMVRLLLEYGAEIADHSGGWMHIASHMGYTGLCDLFLDYGADVDAPDDDGYTPLLLAAWQGKEPVVNLFLDKGASVHTECNDGQTAMYKASGQRHEAVVGRLLEYGARPNDGRGAAGETTLFKATSKGDVEIVRQLLAAKADPNIPNSAVMSKGGRPARSGATYHLLRTAHGQVPDPKILVGKFIGK